jgi:transposase
MANTLNPNPRRTRRYYSEEFKSQVIQECGDDRASVAGVAMRHQVNANIVHRWLREHEAQGLHAKPSFLPVTVLAEPVSSLPASPAAVKVTDNPPQAESSAIRVEVWNGNNTIAVTWPMSEAAACGAWLAEWLK